MTLMDRNILQRTGEFYADIAAAYDDMKYNAVSDRTSTLLIGEAIFNPTFLRQVFLRLQRFLAQDLSAFYFHRAKDTLYCDAPDDLRRRSAVTVIFCILNALKVQYLL